MTAADLLRTNLIDGIVPEPEGGAHLDHEATIAALRETLKQALKELAFHSAKQIINERYAKFRNMGSAFVYTGTTV
jgi:acetyl-CoA carboxylase alpha subunit